MYWIKKGPLKGNYGESNFCVWSRAKIDLNFAMYSTFQLVDLYSMTNEKIKHNLVDKRTYHFFVTSLVYHDFEEGKKVTKGVENIQK